MLKNVTLKDLAEKLNRTVEELQQFLSSEGHQVSEDVVLSSELSSLILQKFQTVSDAKRKVLQRVEKKTLSVRSSTGRNKSIGVKIKKKRVYVKKDLLAPEPESIESSEAAPIETANVDVKSDVPLEKEPKVEAVNEDKVEEVKEAKVEEDTQKTQITSETKSTTKILDSSQIKKVKVEQLDLDENTNSDEVDAFKQTQEENALKRAKELAEKQAKEARLLAEENAKRWEKEEAQRREAQNNNDTSFTSASAKAAEEETFQQKRGARRKQVTKDKGTKKIQHGFVKPAEPVERIVELTGAVSVSDLAQKMAVKSQVVIKEFFKMGTMVRGGDIIDMETAQLLAEEMGHKVVIKDDNQLEKTLVDNVVYSDERQRAPIVTIMGHVDHGKTSLLDYIRKAKVADSEKGGITQHIGAYHVDFKKGPGITFLDTPGHAAFSAMRARGAELTDIVILVVSAEDGVKPQTIEAIQHSLHAKVPLIVAVNKIDKPNIDLERVKTELASHGVQAEDWGGEHQFVYVSAKTGEGIDELFEAISLQSELLELKAGFKGHAKGLVIESSLDKGRGPVATVLVQSGTLNKGDILLCGTTYGRVRGMFDENNRNVKTASPSMPVQVIGLSSVPDVGDESLVVDNDKKAREVADLRIQRQKEQELAKQRKLRVDNLFSSMGKEEQLQLRLLVKADVRGSLEAIIDSLHKLSTEKVSIEIVLSGVGGISESDVSLASASNAVILGFNVRAGSASRKLAEKEHIDIRYYGIIYQLLEEVQNLMKGLLAPVYQQQIIGLAQVRDVFRSPKFGSVAGCMVTEGVIKRSHAIRVLRDDIVIYEGELESLRRFKDDVQEVKRGIECGIAVKNYNDVRVGDMIEVFESVEVAQEL